jgi:phage tail-like protein
VRKGFAPNGAPGRTGPGPNGDPAADTFLASGAVPLGSLLPAVYQEYDDNALRFTGGLDGVLAPVWLSIDCYDAYLDPAISPDDVTTWLANWVGIVAEDTWHPERLPDLVGRASELFRWRGTEKGVADLIEAYTGLRPEIVDNGGVTASAVRGGNVSMTERPMVVVRLPRPALGDDEARRADRLDRLTALVEATTPAHVLARVELV